MNLSTFANTTYKAVYGIEAPNQFTEADDPTTVQQMVDHNVCTWAAKRKVSKVKALQQLKKLAGWGHSPKLTTLAVDTEYVSKPDHPNLMLTTQLAASASLCTVLEHPSLGLGILPTWAGKTALTEALGQTIEHYELPPGEKALLWTVELLVFFAPADVLAGLFSDRSLLELVQANLTQSPRLRIDTGGKFNNSRLALPIFYNTQDGWYQLAIEIKDLCLVNGQTGLKAACEAHGIQMGAKDKLDKWKANMDEAYTTPELLPTYLEYAADDAKVLFLLREGNQQKLQNIYAVHGLQPPAKEILTMGSLVAGLFESYIDNHIGDAKGYTTFTTLDAKGNPRPLKLSEYLGYSTVKAIAEHKDSTKAALGLIQGGRAKNEKPTFTCLKEPVADIDISGAYASLLLAMSFPVGLPSFYYRYRNTKQKPITLGTWLEKTKGQLIPRLWVAVVTGSLSFNQTLIPSKLCDPLDIGEEFDPEEPKIDADFRLYTKEIINGVITSDVMEVLSLQCSSRELSEILKLPLVSACFYSSENMSESAADWNDSLKANIEQSSNDISTVFGDNGSELTADIRSRQWFKLPLREFLQPYTNKRKEYKSLMKQEVKGTAVYESLNAQQTAMKLVGNVLYGAIASGYFSIGNVVVANNITAGVRCFVWMTAVALNLYQSITDGGAYPINRVLSWEGRYRPSMNTLAKIRDLDLLTKHELFDTKLTEHPLGNDGKWLLEKGKIEGGDKYTVATNDSLRIEAKEEGWGELDTLALTHVTQFFRPSPLTPSPSLLSLMTYGHKDLYQSASFHSQTNYQFTHVHGDVKTKVRGVKTKSREYVNPDGSLSEPGILKVLPQLLHSPSAVHFPEPQTTSEILKVGKAKQMQTSKLPNALKDNGLLAGDSVVKKTSVNPLPLSQFFWQTDVQYQGWKKGVEALKTLNRQRGIGDNVGLELLFKNPDGSYSYDLMLAFVQLCIDRNMQWGEMLRAVDQGTSQALKTYRKRQPLR
jgi:hypothetical protein